MKNNLGNFNYICSVCVWGPSYTKLFLEIALPSQLSDNNLPNLPGNNKYVIYTTSVDKQTIINSKIFKNLDNIIPVEFIEIEKLHQDFHAIMSDGHRAIIKYASKLSNYAIIFLTPDTVISDGSLSNVHTLAMQGSRVVSCVGLRLNLETVRPELKKISIQNNNVNILNIKSRDLMDIAMKHLHEITTKHIWNNQNEELIPNNIFWKIGENGLLGRCFHLHPLLVYPEKIAADFHATIDYDFPFHACPTLENHYVVTNSDEICICELTTEKRSLHGIKKKISHIMEFCELSVNISHLYNSSHFIKLHNGLLNTSIYEEKLMESNILFDNIYKEMNTNIMFLIINHPKRIFRRIIKNAYQNLIKPKNFIILLTSKLIICAYCIYKKYRSFIFFLKKHALNYSL